MQRIVLQEPVGLRSHVLSDWTSACLADGKVTSRTDGTHLPHLAFRSLAIALLTAADPER